ncbi:MAG: TIGR04283 family arsenosugar biosynthesis glycosyltransferase [Gammaproteobacteria bacterium]|nr:TIGR04283 family arsenosugar biosynthesis glycosyltransferase [Gammaproteobacteria bacterium]
MAAILPVLNEAAHLEEALSALIEDQHFDEIIVVDGGSTDASVEIVCKFISSVAPDTHPVPILIQSPRGRARQMQAGAQAAEADVLLFLHADIALPPGAADDIRDAIDRGRLWGRFDMRLSGRHVLLRIIERLMNWRSRVTGIVTGDQGMFVRKDVYRVLGGFAPLELMEDIEFSTRLKWFGKPACLPGPVVVSSRRWERNGIIRTVMLMWTLRFLYWLGVSPARLARWYYRPIFL